MAIFRVLFVMISMLLALLLLRELAIPGNDHPSVAYLYLSTSKLSDSYFFHESDELNIVQYDDVILSFDIKSLGAEDYFFFSANPDSWIHFAYPVQKKPGQTSWSFRDCDYIVIDRIDFFSKSRKESEPVLLIDRECGDHDVTSRFIFHEVQGLLAMSRGKLTGPDRLYDFDLEESYFLYGPNYGFGSGRDD